MSESLPPRHLSLFDLLSLGVGGTIGTGLFVLVGHVLQTTGRGGHWSWLLAGAAASLSATAFAEWSLRHPVAGSTYAYLQQVSLPTSVGAACLTLEYAVSGAAVARSWGDKLWPAHGRIPGFLLSVVCTWILYKGVHESKMVTNAFTVLKMALVVLILGAGAWIARADLSKALSAPTEWQQVSKGAMQSFFGFLGFDEVSVVAGEARHPTRDMPWAVMGTLMIVTICYVGASIVLSALVEEDGDISGFPSAFAGRGKDGLAAIIAAGELSTLPVVVLVSLWAQPRLLQSLAQDGRIPSRYAKVDDAGNLRDATLMSGIGMTICAVTLPFDYLDSVISAGILVAFTLTNVSLVLVRCGDVSSTPRGSTMRWLLLAFNISSAVMCWFLSNSSSTAVHVVSVSGTILLVAFVGLEYRSQARRRRPPLVDHFQTPLVPYWPCLAMILNWYLIVQLDWTGCVGLLVYLVAFSLLLKQPTTPNDTTYRLAQRHEHDSEINLGDEGDGIPLQEVLPSR